MFKKKKKKKKDLIVHTGNRFAGELSSIKPHQHPSGLELGNWVQVAVVAA
jgi:hypothetical protein